MNKITRPSHLDSSHSKYVSCGSAAKKVIKFVEFKPKKKRDTSCNSIHITKELLIFVSERFRQEEAAKLLGLSLSTLKRKYYKLVPGSTWPRVKGEYSSNCNLCHIDSPFICNTSSCKVNINPAIQQSSFKVEIDSIVNKTSIDEKHIELQSLKVLEIAFKTSANRVQL